MDQRRFLSFLLLSVLVLMFFNILVRPPQPPADEQPQAQPPLADQAPGENGVPAEAPLGAVPALSELDAPGRFATLGSLDREKGYRMLVTFTSVGAAVQRAELSSPDFLDQDDRSGYWGELELKQTDGGMLVQAAGDGTPAQLAGISAGDVIERIETNDGARITNIEEVQRASASLKPGQEVAFIVKRGDDAPIARTVQLQRRPFAVLRPEVENFQMRGDEIPPDFAHRPSFLLTLAALGEKRLDAEEAKRLATALEDGNWELLAQDQNSITFRRPLGELGLEVVKRYTLAKVPTEQINEETFPGYHLQLDIEIRNAGDSPRTLAYRIDGPTGMPTEGWWYAHKISQTWSAAGLRDVVVRFDGLKFVQLSAPAIADGDVPPMGDGKALAFAGVDGQYFSSIMIPGKVERGDAWIETTEAVLVGPKIGPALPATYNNVTCRLTREAVTLAAGEVLADSFLVFIGPKRPALLAQYQPGGNAYNSLADVVYYGWPLFAAVARWMLVVLHFFYGFVGNYGIAIVMLTVLVRGALFPLSWKQTQSMARMQALKPEMDRINEKYKTDMQKRSQELQALYRKHNINPLGGCLPMLLQLPVFVGLYKGLMIDVELRGSPLLSHAIRWCSNLAAPDMLLNWSAFMPDFVNRGIGLFGLGPYFNLLPVITVVLFLVTQNMAMPPATNEQAALQQKMMKYMTIFFGLMFYKVASGLCLYFIASSLWGIAERKMLKKSTSSGGDAAAAVAAPETPRTSRPAKPSGNGSAGGKHRQKHKRKR